MTHRDDIEPYFATSPCWETWDASTDDLSLNHIRQLASLVWQVLHRCGRDSVYIDDEGRLREARIAWTAKHRSTPLTFDYETRKWKREGPFAGTAFIDATIEGRRRILHAVANILPGPAPRPAPYADSGKRLARLLDRRDSR